MESMLRICNVFLMPIRILSRLDVDPNPDTVPDPDSTLKLDRIQLPKFSVHIGL